MKRVVRAALIALSSVVVFAALAAGYAIFQSDRKLNRKIEVNAAPGNGSAMPIHDSDEKFRDMMRTGKRPNGSDVNPVMPFGALKNLSDTDLGAMYAYLKTVRAKDAGGR